uniref:Retrotransposon Copia-like N-terminal domain-containing protein n=1 Tax=Lactuca sativa TaxID=4236 RepID=A0A9R1XB24_LACSA|nr:hypothetical protein LSAT_V11C600316360 [Lactuca sativa]
MANNSLILGLIPSINIKLDHDNYSLWRSNILSALATFDLAEFVLSPIPPIETLFIIMKKSLSQSVLISSINCGKSVTTFSSPTKVHAIRTVSCNWR